MKALIVEDDYTHRLLLQTFLAKFGTCDVAMNGREAVRTYRSALEAGNPYDMICMDVIMPEMDGHLAVQQIRVVERSRGVKPGSQVRIIMTTALSDRGNVIVAAREQCDAYMVKPIDTGKLLSYLESFGFA